MLRSLQVGGERFTAGVTVPSFSPGTLVLDPKLVGRNIEVVDEIAQPPRTFRLELFGEPWPLSGDSIGLEVRGTRLQGLVTFTKLASSVHGWQMEVRGHVMELEAKGVVN